MRRCLNKIEENWVKIAADNADFKPLPSLLQLIQRKKDQTTIHSNHYFSLALDAY
jgi:hypothetical protein